MCTVSELSFSRKSMGSRVGTGGTEEPLRTLFSSASFLFFVMVAFTVVPEVCLLFISGGGNLGSFASLEDSSFDST